MADFISGFWDLYVAGFIVFGLLLCLILMVANMTSQESGAPQLQGHVWDETLREYNNPLPRWWLILFVGTVLFAIIYLVVYPGFGSRNSTAPYKNDTGLRMEYAEEMRQAKTVYSLEKYAGNQNLAALAADKDAMATGQRLFLTYCTQCHGSSGKGSRGYPNLTDSDWLYGGDPETIKASIADGRAGVMTPFEGTLNKEQIEDVANYVLTLSGSKEKADPARAARGKPIFENPGNCALCHGVDGKGALAMATEMGSPGLAGLGGPNLTDDTWLYDDKLETIIEGITHGRNNAMPTWKHFLDDAKLNLLAAYVYSLSTK
ncbi:MAG: cytochrome-c oxidase, cbb3-type subunit III [Betaproteobacteria bacterium]|nr:cytochrome-c oxidase, cbb3-type subunit III [Betaproteobacteria bacterium]